MCPACFTNLLLFAVGATSSGGLTALAFSKFYRRKSRTKNERRPNETARDGN
jgi:hypothetical protein